MIHDYEHHSPNEKGPINERRSRVVTALASLAVAAGLYLPNTTAWVTQPIINAVEQHLPQQGSDSLTPGEDLTVHDNGTYDTTSLRPQPEAPQK